MAVWRTTLILAVLAVLCHRTYAIYEDQSGTFDWYRQQLGLVTAANLFPAGNRLAVATAGNLLGVLSGNNGSVSWRRTYTTHDALDAIVTFSSKPALIAAISRHGSYVRAWEPTQGLMKWQITDERAAEGSSSSPVTAAALVNPEGGAAVLAVATGATVQAIEPSSGKLLWRIQLQPAATAGSKLLLSSSNAGVHVVAIPGSGAALASWTLAWADGSVLHQQQLEAEAPVASADSAGPAVVALLQGGRTVCSSTLQGAGELKCLPVPDVAPGVEAAQHVAAAGAGAVTLTSATQGVALVGIAEDASLQLLGHYPSATAASAAVAAPGGATYLAVGQYSSSSGAEATGALQIKVVDAATGKAAFSFSAASIKQQLHPGGAAPQLGQLFLLVNATTSRSTVTVDHMAVAAVLTDHQLLLVNKAGVKWQREEALGSVTRSLMVDLPARVAGAAAAAEASQQAAAAAPQSTAAKLAQLLLGVDLEQLQRWGRLQLLGALVQFKLNSLEEQDELFRLRQELSDKNLPYRDTKGLRKQVVVLTSSGKVLALHNGDGRILWSTFLPQFAAADPSDVLLLPWRMHHDLTHAPELLLIKKGPAEQSLAVVVQAHTGAVLQQLDMPVGGVAQVSSLGVVTTEAKVDQQTYLLVAPATSGGSPPAVTLLPHTPSTLKHLSKAPSKGSSAGSSRFFWSLQPAADGGRSSIVGYSVAVLQEQVLARKAWEVSLPGKVLALKAKDPTAPVHSSVKILGDRSFKYKYTNPNLLLVAVGTSSPREAVGQQHVTVLLLDTVTGAVVQQQLHPAATGPVHALVSEHWAAYTFTDLKTMRPQVNMVELYVVRPYNTTLDSLIKGQLQPPVTSSSYAAVDLQVLRQSFYLQHRIKAMGVTVTRQGITTQQLLLGTLSDQVFALDQRFLDPRRPLRAKATPQEMEERLMPYSELIPFFPTSYITQDKQVAQLQHILSVPSALESTSLVLVTGVDLLYTRATPARHFDSLEPDFSYGLLVVGLLGLTAAAVAMKYYSQQSVVKQKWA